MPLDKKDSNSKIEEKIERELQTIGAGVSAADIDRAHRIGDTEKREVIVKFCSWKARNAAYRARKVSSWKFRADITKRRAAILSKARKHMESPDVSQSIEFVFVDVNCRMTAKGSDNKFYHFNCETEFLSLIDKINGRHRPGEANLSDVDDI